MYIVPKISCFFSKVATDSKWTFSSTVTGFNVFTPYNSTLCRKSHIQMCSYLFISHLLSVSCTGKKKKKTLEGGQHVQHLMSPASDIIPPTSLVRWNVWNELLLLYDQTGPTSLASHRSVLAREELQLKGKEAKQKKNHCHHVFSVQSLHNRRHTNGSDSCHIFLSSELRSWTQHCERIVNWHWGACIANSTNKSDLDISIRTCMGPNKAESAERIKWEWIGPVYCEESNPPPAPPPHPPCAVHKLSPESEWV